MKPDMLQDADRFAKAHQRKKRWYQIVVCLAAIVVFCTTYLLILPAITLEKGECDKEEHIHDDLCYIQTDITDWEAPICTVERLNLHQHTADCYDEHGELICGYADFVVHTHDSNCFDQNGNLWCTLPEIEEHIHDENCYNVAETTEGKVHVHTDDCYTLQRGERICGKTETDGHAHDENCYKERNYLVCTIPESDEHRHDEYCYETIRELTCQIPEEENHDHTDECYVWDEVLTCGLSTDPIVTTESGKPELICDKEEIILHEHNEKCFDENGSLICGKIQILEHVHTEECFDTIKELTCEIEEHTHSEACSSQSELTGEVRKQVEEVIRRIDALPFSDEIKEKEEVFRSADDKEGLDTYLAEIRSQVRTVYESYERLTEDQKEEVTNADKLMELEWLWKNQALTDDSALVCELQATGSVIVSDEDPSGTASVKVHNKEVINYGFSVRTESYTEEVYEEGRVKLEFVLPTAETEASFDLEAMAWLDDSEGYAPEVTTETRTIGEEEISCQILTGYKLLSSQKHENNAIPGEFSEDAVVSVRNMDPGDTVSLQISAAMEHSAWEGSCEAHQREERLTVTTDTVTVAASYTAEEQQKFYQEFLEEIEELEARGNLEEEARAQAEDLLKRLQKAYQQGKLTEKQYTELYDRVRSFIEGDFASIAEAAEGDNWLLLRDSGWFEAYSSSASASSYAAEAGLLCAAPAAMTVGDETESASVPPSDVQVEDRGGTNTSEDGTVAVSKTISGTNLENVFDITLQVQTSVQIDEICGEPDMAVVIVMDISNTMNSNFGDTTRYAAAMDAAESFLDEFAASNSLGISKVGYVAFNTDAHQIFGLQSCSNEEQVNALKNKMRTQTGSIINASGYDKTHNRFTNVEAGLAMASDMLNDVANQNKYIIFLSDGFPTTYISSGYSGFDPYDSTGRFYDRVLKKPCLYGTSYSDEAAIRARNKAAAIKNSGITIFSVGVDVSGQTIQQYITQSENASDFSVVDRTGTTYEIGDASSTEAYKNWLRSSIGSGYYYDSTNSSGLQQAYENIFKEIKHKIEAGSAADWVASDPLPTVNGSEEMVEFIGFYDKTPVLTEENLKGEYEPDGENTAAFDAESSRISWNLKQSGYQITTGGNTTVYTYQLVYRVRLKNEHGDFVEGTIYPTNDTTTLQYRSIQGTDGNLTVSDPKTVEFPIPSVEGYLAGLEFKKAAPNGAPLAGAEFTLQHDTKNCSLCRGDNRSSVEIEDMTAVSVEDGTVSFSDIPSGHKYTLTETRIPEGCTSNGDRYSVEVAYDELTVTVTTIDGEVRPWDGRIENQTYHELPKTGGIGIILYTLGGILLVISAGSLLIYNHIRRRRGDCRLS